MIDSIATKSIKSNSVVSNQTLGTPGSVGVSVAEYGDGRFVETVITLDDFPVMALAGAAAALGGGGLLYTLPAGQALVLAIYQSISLKAAGTAVAVDLGIGSVVASGAVSVLSGTATFEDYNTGTATTTSATGGTAVALMTTAGTASTTLGVGTIFANAAADVKAIFCNAAATWNANNTGNLTADGTVTSVWCKISA